MTSQIHEVNSGARPVWEGRFFTIWLKKEKSQITRMSQLRKIAQVLS